MQKLRSEEVESLKLKESGYSSSKGDAFYKAMTELLVGEALKIEKNEWPYKSAPNYGNIPKRLKALPYAKYRTRTLADDSAWIVQRVA